ncbi:hypothetical protein BH18ACT15_BH18ACT15_11090 [soil metagenome]
MSFLRPLLDKLTRPPEDIRDEHLRAWVEAMPGVTPIGDLAKRRRFKAAGVIQTIRIDPREGSGSIEATISDGTGDMIVKWLGRQTMSGIRLGAGLIVEGIVGGGEDGRPLVLNPEYQLTIGPR